MHPDVAALGARECLRLNQHDEPEVPRDTGWLMPATDRHYWRYLSGNCRRCGVRLEVPSMMCREAWENRGLRATVEQLLFEKYQSMRRSPLPAT